MDNSPAQIHSTGVSGERTECSGNWQYSHHPLCHSWRLLALDEHSSDSKSHRGKPGRNLYLSWQGQGEQHSSPEASHIPPPHGRDGGQRPGWFELKLQRERESVNHELPHRPHSKREQGFKDLAMTAPRNPGTPRNSWRREAYEQRREKSPLDGALSFPQSAEAWNTWVPQNVELQNSLGAIIGIWPQQTSNRINIWGEENRGLGTQGRDGKT